MRRYRFRLDPVLRMRRIEEERAIAELAEAQRAEDRANRLRIARLERYEHLPYAHGVVSTSELLCHRDQWERAASAVVSAGAEHLLAVREVELRRSLWTKAAGKVTSLENLDERKREEHRFEANKAETAELDELTSARFARQT